MSLITQPLLASKLTDFEKLQFPVYVTPKLDGIRALKIDGCIVSRSFKPIRNKKIADILKNLLPDGADGEILSGRTFQDATSAVMTADANIENTSFFWFDYVKDSISDTYLKRMDDIKKYMDEHSGANEDIKIVPLYPTKIENVEDLVGFEKLCLDQGFEGVMIRSGDGPYKCGRSTEKQGILMKMKKFDDSEAIIVGVSPFQKNLNEKTTDNFGYSKRSTHKDNKVDMDMLGSFEVDWNGIRFSIGSGFDHKLRKEFWKVREDLIGKIVKFKYFSQGMKSAPRFPTFIGIRDHDDM